MMERSANSAFVTQTLTMLFVGPHQHHNRIAVRMKKFKTNKILSVENRIFAAISLARTILRQLLALIKSTVVASGAQRFLYI